jgi:GAF domain-containing protein
MGSAQDDTKEFEVPRKKPDVPDAVTGEWQGLVDSLALQVGVPVGLVMKAEFQRIVVFVSSATKGNPYKKGDGELMDSGLYCEAVMARRESLLIPNALADPEWEDNPDVKLGMISYLGYPLLWPDGEVFGTLCVLDTKENSFSSSARDRLCGVKGRIEEDLRLLQPA